MNHYRQYGLLDDQTEIVGDGAFNRLDMLTDPAMLPAGSLALCENMRFAANGTTVRAGMARQFPAGQTVNLIYGVAVFKPAADEDYLAFATANFIAFFNLATQTFQYATYPSGEVISADDRVDMVQAGVGEGTLPTLYILRGISKTVLKYDANTGLVTVASGFAQGNFALFYQDRIAVGQAQQVPVSNFLDFTTFGVLSQFQILKGGSDYLQGFATYQGDYVLIGTRQAWYIAFFDPSVSTGGYSGNLTDTSFVRQLTQEAGPVGPDASVEANGLVWFIAGGAIYAFQPRLDNQLTVLGKPISADLQPLMDRMCVTYAQRASIKRYGYRLYFAVPISDEPVAVSTVTITLKDTPGLNLPFNLPAYLSTNSLAEIATVLPHNLTQGDTVQLANALAAGLNGTFTVNTVLDDYTITVRLNIDSTATAGTRMTVQRLATRNNCILVYNLNNQGFESVDWMPGNLFADWLRVVEHGARRRLMVIDQEAGPFLYEETEADEVGDSVGGIRLPFNLPIQLTVANYATQPIAGRIKTRSLRWGAYNRKVRACEARATLDADSQLTMKLLVTTPNNRTWTGTRNFSADQFTETDVPLRKICGERGLEAQVEILTSGGRPTIRSVLVETANVGKVEE